MTDSPNLNHQSRQAPVKRSRPAPAPEPDTKLLAEQARSLVREAHDLLEHRQRRIANREQLSQWDGLTGLINRRGFFRRFQREVTQARRRGRPGTLVLFELCGLDQINAGYGHAVGDRTLKIVAEYLTRAVQRGDAVARIGGNDFAVLLGSASPAMARARAARICRRFARNPASLGAGGTRLALNPGVVTFDGQRGIDALMRTANQKLQDVKHAASWTVKPRRAAA